LDEAQVVESLRALVGHAGLKGAVCLSTCNRTEFYVTTQDAQGPERTTSRFFHYLAPTPETAAMVFSRPGEAGLKHVFRVASGLDSMILGEAQVLAQFKRAHRIAQQAGTVDAELDLVMRRAVEAAKQVRSTTGISRQAVGFGQVAVKIAQRQLGGLRGRGVVILGGGSVGGSAARLLRRAGADPILVVRRGHRAEAVAEAVGGELVALEELPLLSDRFQLIVCSTSSEARVLAAAQVAAIRQCQPSGSRLLILDLAVPRDVEPEAARLEGVDLFDIDHLQDVIAANLNSREAHRPKAEKVVLQSVAELTDELETRGAASVIAALVDRAEVVRQGELQRAISRMRPIDATERAHLERLTQAIAAKLMHQPITFLRKHADDPERRRLLEEAVGLLPAEAAGED
jgi:glutamyl-tRNA reductase